MNCLLSKDKLVQYIEKHQDLVSIEIDNFNKLYNNFDTSKHEILNKLHLCKVQLKDLKIKLFILDERICSSLYNVFLFKEQKELLLEQKRQLLWKQYELLKTQYELDNGKEKHERDIAINKINSKLLDIDNKKVNLYWYSH